MLIDRFRSRLPSDARQRVRDLTDPVAGPLGSIRGARTTDPVVALTFDDGPDPATTPAVLDALAAFEATATFFVLLDRAESHPDLIARMSADGHDVGLHGVDHRRLTHLSRQELTQHLREGSDRLEALTGRPTTLFRPPYGSQNLRSYAAARRLGMEVVVWSDDCDDWSPHPEATIAARVIGSASPGSVLLLHDALAEDPDEPTEDPGLDRRVIVRSILAGLRSNGLASVSMTELLRRGSVHRTLWFRH